MRSGLIRKMSGFGTSALASAALALVLTFGGAPARADEMQDGLVRLSEILGAVHHLREICGANEGALWRNKMIDMLNVAALDADGRQRLISHFNDAYFQALKAFPDCSASAAAKSNALFDEAHRLAARLAGTDRSAAANF